MRESPPFRHTVCYGRTVPPHLSQDSVRHSVKRKSQRRQTPTMIPCRRGAVLQVLVAAALLLPWPTAHAQYGPPRKQHKKPHAPLPPVDPADPSFAQPSIPFVASSPPPADGGGNSLDGGAKGDYWWMSGGGSIFSQPGPAPAPPPQGCGGGVGGGAGCGGSGGVSSGNPFIPGGGGGGSPNRPSTGGGCGGDGGGSCGGAINPDNPFIGSGSNVSPGGCGGGVKGGSCGGNNGGSGSGGSYPNNPFLTGNKGPASGSQTVPCTQPGHVCVPKQHCRNGIVAQENQVTQGPCVAATQACCFRPTSAPSPPGCTGPPGKFVCGGLGPDDGASINFPDSRQPGYGGQPGSPGSSTYTPGTPGQPGLIHITPGSPGTPGSTSYTPGQTAQPGLIHIAPGRPGTPGSASYTPGQSPQPGSVSYTPGTPAQPGTATYTPGRPAQPGSATYTPGRPAQPGSVTYTPSQPAQPGSVTYTPGQPSQPGSGTYTPGQPGQPGSATYTPGQPGSTSYTPSGQPSQPGLIHIQPTNANRPGYGSTGNPIGSGSSVVPFGGSTYDSQSSVTQKPYTGPLNTTPYPGCAAALKCVPENLCTMEGVMTDRPVSLTREQLEGRVPLADCADPETGILGKCCRDPNYKDPWPGGMMMMGPGQSKPDECGPSAQCLHTYLCADANKVAPAKTCRVPLDGATGVCCSAGGSANFPTASGSAPQPTVRPGTQYYTPGKPAQPGTVSYQPGTPAQPGTATYTPGTPAQPGSVSYQPGTPAQPGSVSYQPGTPAQPGSVSYQPGTPAQPGRVTYQPGYPAQPGKTSYRPGSPAQPGSVNYQPGSPAQPGSVNYQPGSPAQPGNVNYQPGSPAQPGSVNYQPGSPAQPGSVNYQPGSPAQPGNVNYQPSRPGTPGSASYTPGTPAKPAGSVSYQPGVPAQPGPQPQPATVKPTFYEPVGPNNPSGPNCGIVGPVRELGQSGGEAGLGEFPWQVLVLSAANGSALCSGALVSPGAVATSAHCIGGARAVELLVVVSAWRLGSPANGAQELRVAAIARHPSFDSGSLAHDMALLLLESQLSAAAVTPICLPPASADSSYQRSCVATGWGKNAIQGNVKGSPLHKVPVDFVPQSQCEQTLRQTNLGKYFILNKSCQCALPSSPDYDLCLVDAGGPIGCDRGDGRLFLAGLYSWDVGCSTKTNPAVLAGIDIEWIQSVLSKPVNQIAQEEEEEARHRETVGQSPDFDTDSKPGFSQGYGKK